MVNFVFIWGWLRWNLRPTWRQVRWQSNESATPEQLLERTLFKYKVNSPLLLYTDVGCKNTWQAERLRLMISRETTKWFWLFQRSALHNTPTIAFSSCASFCKFRTFRNYCFEQGKHKLDSSLLLSAARWEMKFCSEESPRSPLRVSRLTSDNRNENIRWILKSEKQSKCL